jgi:hypothetical protein
MVYKKYIEKDGKVYGPYVYHSRRVNGKIISEYCGQGKGNKKKIFLFVFIALVLLAVGFFIFNGKFTGNAVSENPTLIQGESENAISYPTIYFTLVSIQTKSSESYSESTPQVQPENETTSQENLTESNIENSSEQQEVIIENSTIPNETFETNSSDSINEQEISSSDVPVTEQKDISSETKNNEQESSPAGENSVSGVLESVGTFFLGLLKTTGMAVSEQTVETRIDGQTSMNEPFVYQLKEGENVQLLSGSVKTNSDSLPDSVIKMTYKDNLLLVSTNYSEIIKQITNSNNNSKLKIVKENLPDLTEEEKNILSQKLGNFSIETVKSELFNGRYVLGYRFGDFTIEYSYDSDLSKQNLDSQIEYDKIKWLKDISEKLSQENSAHNPVNLS